MSGWHSLQGYLGYRPSGALGRLKAKKRQWFVFEERSCQLLFYKTESDASSCKAASGSIDLRAAAISLNMDDPHQFIVHSRGKEHILTAETHESTMIWLLALQAKRDAFSSQLSMIVEQGTVDFKEREELKRKESLPSDQEIRQMIRRAMCAESDGGGGSGGGSGGIISFGGGLSGLLRSKSVREPKQTLSSYPSATSLLHVAAHPVPKGRLLLPGHLQHRQSVDLGALKTESLGRESRVRTFSGGSLATNTDSEDTDSSFAGTSTKLSSPRLPSCDPSPTGIPFTEPLHLTLEEPSLMMLATADGCHSPLAQLSPRRGALLRTKSDSLQSLESFSNRHQFQMNGSFMASSSNQSSDRLRDLESDLVTAKIELAKALNREANLKDVIKDRDDVIKHLEEQIKHTPMKTSKGEDSSPSHVSSQRLQEKCRILQNQNRFLNEEVLKLSRMWQQEQMKFLQQNHKITDLEIECGRLKRDYVFLLQSSVRIAGGDGPDFIEVPIYGGSRHKNLVSRLLDEARKVNPSLPSLDGMAKSGCHVDTFGFKHCYINEGLMLHYVCGQLHQHYGGQLTSSEQNQKRWKEVLRQCGSTIPRTKELKKLIRSGIPNHLRSRVWGMLVQEKVKDIKENKGSLYYNQLCSMISDSPVVGNHRRQISLDLLRTMPNNVHFNENDADGVKKMQEVLQTFCLHNSQVGYCQGMNFIVGMALLFMKADDAFWFLVAITERYFPPNYFDQNLMGAQADQEVLKDILGSKLTPLANHMQRMDIELSTICLNWFLAIFFDSVPFDTLLRIWDCFLYEGPKVLFRFSMAILKMNESCLLDSGGTISIMRQLKASSKLCYDVEGLMKTAFEDLKPFPRRAEIASKQTCFLKTLKEKLKKRSLEQEASETKDKMLEDLRITTDTLSIDCATIHQDHIWACEGKQNLARVLKIDCSLGTKKWLDIQFHSRVMSIHCMSDAGLMIFGTLSRCVFAYHIHDCELAWQLPVNDAVLSVCSLSDCSKNRLYAALADGTVAVVEWSSTAPVDAERSVFYIMVSSSLVSCINIVEKRLWCASGNRIAILHAKTLDTIDQFTVSANSLDTISSITEGKHGVWILLCGSSTFQLWDPKNLVCRTMFDVKENRTPKITQETSFGSKSRVTSILPGDRSLWIGTGDGHILIYDVYLLPSRKASAFNSPRICGDIDGTSMELVNEKIQELYLQQNVDLASVVDTSDDKSKQMRGRSDSGYQTVGDVSRENSVVPQCSRGSVREGVNTGMADLDDLLDNNYNDDETHSICDGAVDGDHHDHDRGGLAGFHFRSSATDHHSPTPTNSSSPPTRILRLEIRRRSDSPHSPTKSISPDVSIGGGGGGGSCSGRTTNTSAPFLTKHILSSLGWTADGRSSGSTTGEWVNAEMKSRKWQRHLDDHRADDASRPGSRSSSSTHTREHRATSGGSPDLKRSAVKNGISIPIHRLNRFKGRPTRASSAFELYSTRDRLRNQKELGLVPTLPRGGASVCGTNRANHHRLLQSRCSFDDVAHLLMVAATKTGSGESLLSSPTCDSFDFDDVFVSYTEDEGWISRKRPSLPIEVELLNSSSTKATIFGGGAKPSVSPLAATIPKVQRFKKSSKKMSSGPSEFSAAISSTTTGNEGSSSGVGEPAVTATTRRRNVRRTSGVVNSAVRSNRSNAAATVMGSKVNGKSTGGYASSSPPTIVRTDCSGGYVRNSSKPATNHKTASQPQQQSGSRRHLPAPTIALNEHRSSPVATINGSGVGDRKLRRTSSASSLEDCSSPNSSRIEYDSVQDQQGGERTGSGRAVTRFSASIPLDNRCWRESDSGSFVSLADSDVPYSVEVVLRERKKVSVKPVRCLVRRSTGTEGESEIFSCSGSCSDLKSVLKWTMTSEKKDTEAWISQSVMESSRLPCSTAPSAVSHYQQHIEPGLNSTSNSFVNATSNLVGNSLAKVQNIISNLSADLPIS